MENNNTNDERLFTQEEVNNIIKERVSKIKRNSVPKEKAEELLSKEAELNRQMKKLSFKEHLIDNGYPMGYMDIIGDSESLEEFSAKAEKMSYYSKQRAPFGSSEPVITNNERDPFRSLLKHTPKKY